MYTSAATCDVGIRGTLDLTSDWISTVLRYFISFWKDILLRNNSAIGLCETLVTCVSTCVCWKFHDPILACQLQSA